MPHNLHTISTQSVAAPGFADWRWRWAASCKVWGPSITGTDALSGGCRGWGHTLKMWAPASSRLPYGAAYHFVVPLHIAIPP